MGSNAMVGSFVMNSPVGMLQLWNTNFPRQFQRTLCVIAKNPVARVHLCHLNVSTRQLMPISDVSGLSIAKNPVILMFPCHVLTVDHNEVPTQHQNLAVQKSHIGIGNFDPYYVQYQLCPVNEHQRNAGNIPRCEIPGSFFVVGTALTLLPSHLNSSHLP